MEYDVDPTILAAYDEEADFIQSSGGKARRLKVEKGIEYVLRFLPVKLGSKGLFFARIYNHWVGSRPYFCHKLTSPDFGGDPGVECRLCELTAEMNADRANRERSKAGFRHSANPQWVTFCLLFEKIERDRTHKTKGDERWKPWEFPLSKNGFDDLLAMYKRGLPSVDKPNRPRDGIFDLEGGRDIYVKAKERDLFFQAPDGPVPFCGEKDPAKWDALVAKIWSTVQAPFFNIVSEEDVDLALDRVKHFARGDDRRGTDDRRGGSDDRRRDDRGRGSDDDAPRSRRVDDDAPRSRRDDDEAPRSRRDDDEAPRSRGENDDDDRGQKREPDEDEIRMEDRRPAARERQPERPAAQDQRPPSRSTPPPPARSVTPPPARSAAASPPARSAANTPPSRAAAVESSVDDNDNVTHENQEHAPVADAGVHDHGEAPPAVSTASTPTPPGLSSRLNRGIAAAKSRA